MNDKGKPRKLKSFGKVFYVVKENGKEIDRFRTEYNAVKKAKEKPEYEIEEVLVQY